MAEEKPKGYLVITVIEAAGKNKDEQYVWDTVDFEGYVKSTFMFVCITIHQILIAEAVTASEV